MNEHILIIEDDNSISEMVSEYLSREGYIVSLANNGLTASYKIEQNYESFDLVLLDLLLPEIDGLELLKKLRIHSHIPVLIMSAKGSDVDKALGLGLGADDYISKPFSMIELIARIKALLRRSKYSSSNNTTQIITRGDVSINTLNFSVTINDKLLKLTPTEYEILKLLALNPTRVYTKAQLYNSIWKEEYYGDENVINVHIRRLRKKIEPNPSIPKYITTVWGIGYKFGEVL